MNRFVYAILVFASLPVFAAGWTGIWIGGTTALGDPIFVQMEIESKGDDLRGAMEVPAQNATVPLADIETDGEKIAFRMLTPFGVFAFNGRRDGMHIRGEVKTPVGTTAAMHLLRTEPAANVDAFAGTYRSADGEHLILTTRPHGQLRMIGTRSVSSTRLVSIGGGRFLDAASIVRDPTAGREFTFDRHASGDIIGLSGSVAAKRVDLIDQERVTFRNGAITLGGTLYKPRTKGPHPAAVVVHGSGAVTRDLMLLRAQLLIRRGVAVLLFDKRGTGESSGEWRAASFEDLAGDAVAAAAYLRTRDDIDATRLGVVGHSQAGWIVPIVTSRDPALAFAIILSGGAIAPEQQEIFRAEIQTRDDFPKANPLQAKELTRLMWHYARTGEGWPAYEKAWQEAAREPWFRNIAGPRTADDPQWEQVRLFAAYDPRPYLQSITVPTLVILGANDENHPAKQAAKVWKSVLRESKGSEVHVIPKAGHNLMIRQKNGAFIYAPQYVETMERWLEKRGVRLKGIF